MDLNKIRELAGIPTIAEEDLSPLSEMDPTGEQPSEVVEVITNEEPEDLVQEEDEDDSVEEGFDLNNGYGDEKDVEELGAHGRDYFPSGQTSTAPDRLGPSAAKSGNNPMAAKQFTKEAKEIHESLVYKYRNFKKNSK